MAKAAGLAVDHVILSPMSHAGYYPGGKLMTMKVVFEKETYRLLGAQIVGYEGVDKRIDVLATAIFAGLRATDLKDLRFGLCATVFVGEGSGEHGGLHDREHRRGHREAVVLRPA